MADVESGDTDCIFVFYSINPQVTGENRSWKYDAFPEGWRWTGAGSTSAVGDPKLPYPWEEQFNGTPVTSFQMKEVLIRKFDELVRRNVVEKYKIRNSYNPHR